MGDNQLPESKSAPGEVLTTALSRLGWMSSYTRQFATARQLLRTMIPLIEAIGENKNIETELLRMLRTAIHGVSGNAKNQQLFSAPYEPQDRPTTHFLKFFRSEKVYYLSSLGGENNGLKVGYVSGRRKFSVSIEGFALVETEVLIEELEEIRQGVRLTDKSVGDANCDSVFSLPLWRGRETTFQSRALEWFSELEEGDPKAWSFWNSWFSGFVYGKPIDRELQKRIAQIDEIFWQAGPKILAEKIEEVKASFLEQMAPLSEALLFNDDTLKFTVVPQTIAKPDLLGATLSQVDDALDDALANLSNGLHDASREVRVVRRTIAKYGNDPQRIEMDFTSVHAGLTRQIVTEEIPPSEENLAFQRALEEGAMAIRATHPDVEENRRIIETQKFAELSDEQKAVLAEAQPLLEAISEGVLREDFAADIPLLLEAEYRVPPELGVAERNPVLANYDEKRRTFGRVAKIGVLMRKVPDLVHRIDKSAGYKAARIVTTIGAIITIGIALF